MTIRKLIGNLRRKREKGQGIFRRPKIMPPSAELKKRFEHFEKEGRSLFDFQKQVAAFLIRGKRKILADGPGLSKKAEILSALPSHNVAGTLVVCAAAAKWSWLEEANLWRPELQVIEPKGKKNFVLPDLGEIVLVSWDSLPAEINVKSYRPFALVLASIEDAKRVKSVRSKRIRNISQMAETVIATASDNFMKTPAHLFGMLTSMDLIDELQVESAGAFRKLFYVKEKNSWVPNIDLKEIMYNFALIRQSNTITRYFPPVREEDVVININDGSKKMIDTIIKKIGGFKGLRSLLNPGADEMYRRRVIDIFTSSKFPVLEEMIIHFEINSEPVIILCSSDRILAKLSEMEGWSVIRPETPMDERDQILANFDRGKCKRMAICHKALTGILLTGENYPCITVVLVDMSENKNVNKYNKEKIYSLASRRSYKTIRPIHIMKMKTTTRSEKLMWDKLTVNHEV